MQTQSCQLSFTCFGVVESKLRAAQLSFPFTCLGVVGSKLRVANLSFYMSWGSVMQTQSYQPLLYLPWGSGMQTQSYQPFLCTQRI